MRRELEALRSTYDRQRADQDEKYIKSLNDEKVHLETKLSTTELAEQGLRQSLESLFSEKTMAYKCLVDDVQSQEKEINKAIEILQAKYTALQTKAHRYKAKLETETRRYNEYRLKMETRERRQSLDELHKNLERQNEENHASNQKALVAIENEIKRDQKRKVLKRNLLPLLGVVGGMATVAAGGATLQIPLVAAGIGLVGTAGMKLNFSRKNKNNNKDKMWEVQDHS